MIKESQVVNDQLVNLTIKFNQMKQNEKSLESGKIKLASSLMIKEEETGRLVEMMRSLEDAKMEVSMINKDLNEQLQRARLEVDDLKRERVSDEEIQTKNQEILTLKNQIVLKEEEKAGLFRRLEDVLDWEGVEFQARDELKEQLRQGRVDKEEKMKGLFEKISKIKRKNEEFEEETEKLKIEVKGLKRRGQELTRRVEELKGNNLKLQKIKEDLQSILEEETKSRLELANEFEGVKIEMSRLRKSGELKERENKEREQEFDEIRRKLELMQTECEDYKREKKQSARRLKEVSEEFEKERLKSNSLQIEKEKLFLEKEDLKENDSKLVKQLKEIEEELQIIQDTNAKYEAKLEEINKQCRHLENEKYEIEIEHKTVLQALENSKKTQEQIASDMIALQNQNTLLQTENDHLQKNYSTNQGHASDQISVLQGRLEKSEHDLSNAREELIELAGDKQELLDQIEEFKTEVANLGMEVHSLRQEKQKNIAQIEQLNKQKLNQNIHKHEVMMTERELKDVKEKNRELMKVNEGLKEDKKELGRELLDTQRDFTQKLANALDSLRHEQKEKNMLDLELKEKHREIVFLESQKVMSARSVRSFLANR